MWMLVSINRFGPHDADRSVGFEYWIERIREFGLLTDCDKRDSRRTTEGVQILSPA